MNNLLLIGLGGAVGSICRYLLSNFVYQFLNRGFPYGTLIVNVLGCFVMGILFTVLIDIISKNSDALRALLLIGLLGGFTTFSSFSIETLNLIQNGEAIKALGNIFASVLLCLLATWLGVFLGRQL